MYWLVAANIVLAAAILFAGLKAVKYWKQASRVMPEPEWDLDPTGTVPFPPVDERVAQMGENVAFYKAFEASGALNMAAARWTKITVILGFMTALLNVVAPFVLK
jgi:hypothetical protein